MCKRNKERINLKKVFIASYTFYLNGERTNQAGPVNPLINFFLLRVEELYLVEQPLPGSDTLSTYLTVWKKGEKIICEKKDFPLLQLDPSEADTTKTYLRLKLRDAFSVLYFFLKHFPTRIDFYIGVECVNALVGVILKKMGLVKKTVYYIFDWAPDRYKNKLMNALYIWLDKIATYYSDATWNITYTIEEAKKKILNYTPEKMSVQIYVPYCVDFNGKYVLPAEEVDPNLIIYSGGFIEENGPHLLLQAYKLIKDKFPYSKLMMIGGGGMEERLRDFVRRNNLEKNVIFTGYIAKEEKIMRLQSRAAIGVAPYPLMKSSRKPYGDVIKVRMYFASGLVAISTPVPPVSREIAKEKLGYCTKDDSPQEIAKGISIFLKNKDLLFSYRKNVIEKAKRSKWENNYINALTKMGVS